MCFNKIKILLFLIVAVAVIGCNREKAIVEKLFPNDSDTTNLVKLANFLSDDDVIRIAKSDNGMHNYKGIKEVPQNRDDFRFDTLDDIYWRGISSTKSDFRASSLRLRAPKLSTLGLVLGMSTTNVTPEERAA